MKKVVLLIIIVVVFSPLQLLAQKTRNVIPYTVLGGKMIVEMEINGTPQRLIFDTGGATTVTQKLMHDLGLSATDSMQITDVNSKAAFYKQTRLESILLVKDGVNFKNTKVLIAPEPSPFECYGTEGLIGGELFRNAIVEIDHRAKTITVTSAEKQSPASLRAMHRFAKSGTYPLFPMKLGETNVIVLFDTGYGGFINIKSSDFKASKLSPISEAFAEGSIGMGGQAATALSYRTQIATLPIGGAKYNNVVAETGTPPYTLLGMKILDYCKVTIDYPRCRIYLEAYEKENDMTRVLNDFSLTVKGGKLVISTVWAPLRGIIEKGDEVTHVNGKPVRESYDFCTSITVGYPELREKKKTVFTVNTKNGVKKITQINRK